MRVYQARYVNNEYAEDSRNLGVTASLDGAKALAQVSADELRAEDGLEPEAIEWDVPSDSLTLTGGLTMPGHVSEDSWFEITATELA